MGYPIDVALRYLGSKKRAFISVGTAFAILGVTLGVAAFAQSKEAAWDVTLTANNVSNAMKRMCSPRCRNG